MGKRNWLLSFGGNIYIPHINYSTGLPISIFQGKTASSTFTGKASAGDSWKSFLWSPTTLNVKTSIRETRQVVFHKSYCASVFCQVSISFKQDTLHGAKRHIAWCFPIAASLLRFCPGILIAVMTFNKTMDIIKSLKL